MVGGGGVSRVGGVTNVNVSSITHIIEEEGNVFIELTSQRDLQLDTSVMTKDQLLEAIAGS
jgi:hypothetical protein